MQIGNGFGHFTAAAIRFARAAGVRHLIYTSVLQAPSSRLEIAGDHKATEEVISQSGIAATILRNGWYTENQRLDFDSARERGVIANSIGRGRIASAPRREYGEASTVVVGTPGHERQMYELSGDSVWSFPEFANTASEVLKRPVRYDVLTGTLQGDQLTAAGLPEKPLIFSSASTQIWPKVRST
ncbi:hypothetical protein B7R22_02410 [Subtercola boreus]|uniref:NAD(P)-binding domain-containing protein n=1 Tax=Subtercola boreus TaxID=120213 RepID=A0A3E0W5F6_9MICO|nr:hypothetical protein [Subtercola boreus]RFA16728.1 hypothetical protein B7R22_02410 [Subtercola boreus]